jgi:hypothetical protein
LPPVPYSGAQASAGRRRNRFTISKDGDMTLW